jgi:hypothetical protein
MSRARPARSDAALPRAAFLAAALAFTGACAGEGVGEDDSEETDGALVGGTPAKPGQFPGTVHLEGGCTAAKVSPTLLLTAAHCVLDPATVRPIYGAERGVAIASDPAAGYAPYDVAAVHVHPSWEAACDLTYCGASAVTARLDAPDVALIELARPLEGVATAHVDAAPLRAGERVVVLGYGCTEGVHLRDGRALASLAWADALIVPSERAIHDGSPVTVADAPVFAANYAQTAGPALAKDQAGLCPGDSGGPLFKHIDGALAVVGVNANYTLRPDADDAVGLPVTNWHTRLDGTSKHDVAAWLAEHGALATGR